ncbi:MAG TPA: DNA photolyase [bacterium]|nr:DNA photolyase [bacterium]
MASALPSNVKRLQRRSPAASPFEIEQVWVDRAVESHPGAIRMLSKLGGVPCEVVDDPALLKHRGSLSEAKRQLLLTAHRGGAFKPCQGITREHLCCNYRVIDLVSGCPMDCSYCILQSYLANNPITTVYVNTEAILSSIASFLDENRDRFFRIGTGELSDSLALDGITEHASVLVPFFASRRNALLELKTKTASVDHLLSLNHRGNTVISWSVNTEEVIASDERGTAPLAERIAAAKRAAQAGFGVGFHFDPIILTGGAKDMDGYLEVADRILAEIDPRSIAWVSLGCLRYPPELAPLAEGRFPGTRIFSGELVPAGKKMRYLRFIRQEALASLWNRLAEKLTARKIYLCMETAAVWSKIEPSVTSNACIERRLCNAESISSADDR